MTRPVAVCLGVLLITVFASCSQFGHKETFEEAQAWEKAQKAESGEAVAQFTQFIESYPKSSHVAEAYYFRGSEYLARDNYAKAEQDFNTAHQIGKPAFIKGYALSGLGDVYMEREQFDQAFNYYKKALQSPSKQLGEDRVLYQMGKAAQRSGRWNEADTYFIRVNSEFPASEYAELAREKMSPSDKYFSVQTGAFDTQKPALALQKKLTDAGYQDVFLKEFYRSGKMRLCVRVGKFDTWQKARRMEDRLKADNFDTLIVP
jgi:tetratricopeptide (TPR) repeat protein